MSKFIIGLAVIVVLMGCDRTHIVESDLLDSKICLDGVTYFERSNSLAPVFNRDTKQVELCNE